ncbi:hypothetical protein AS27_00076, partial [Aptenodytes forsteri]
AVVDVSDTFSSIPLAVECRTYFAFSFDGTQYQPTGLPQGYKHSPTLAHNVLKSLLEELDLGKVKIYQYIDDILITGEHDDEVKNAVLKIAEHLGKNKLKVKHEKIQRPGAKVKFLGVIIQEKGFSIPDTVQKEISQLKAPADKKELQTLLGKLGFWRQHIQGYVQLTRPFYNLLQKKVQWEWTLTYQKLLE